MDRRTFLQASLATAALGVRSSYAANERFNIAVLGVRNRGKRLASIFAAQPDVHIAYICDPDENMFASCLEEIGKRQEKAPRAVPDYRVVLDDPSIDGIVVATPDHWHAIPTIQACMAGKHVYVEKPVSHNIVEGRRMIEAARKYDRVVQVGTQRRSSRPLAQMVDFIQSGGIGKVCYARAWTVSKRPNIGHAKDAPTPKGVHYDLWLGPAAARPFNPNHFHYQWHWFWQYGTGELGNNGIHALDVVRWALQIDYPETVVSSGGKMYFDDDQQSPDTQVVCYEYPGLTVQYEHRTWTSEPVSGSGFGFSFYGDKGTIYSDGTKWRMEGGDKESLAALKLRDLESNHQRNWLDCIKTGKRPAADIEQGHLSTALCHLGNISQRVGRKLRWYGDKERFDESERDANELLTREYRSEFPLPTI